jgi:hypothetical protein
LYGVFGGVHAYPNSGTTVGTHTYTIDWSPTGVSHSVSTQLAVVPQGGLTSASV